MNRTFAAAWVIARRDFVATVWSKSFLLFLLAPIIAGLFGGLIAQLTSQADVKASHPTIAVTMDEASSGALRSAHERLTAALGKLALPDLEYEEQASDRDQQAERLLSSEDKDISAVLGGSLTKPSLTGPAKSLDLIGKEVALVIDEARQAQKLDDAGIRNPPVALERVATEESAGRLNMVRHVLARAAQLLIFFLTLMLATMLLSNLVEEKSNKVIEVLAAAVSLDAVFLGKLIAMLGVSVIGVIIWGSLAGLGLIFLNFTSTAVTPAVGWPVFSLLLILYFAANYMLLGAVFLGIGGQASNVREVQTLSMPITFAQVMIFLLASMAIGDDGGQLSWVAAIFPLSSPMAMIALAAQSDFIWPHLAALLWQLFWIAIIIRLSARLFKKTVLKSGNVGGFFDIFRARKV